MAFGFSLIPLIISSILSAVGLLFGAFIVVSILKDWYKVKRLTSCDLILVALGISSTLTINFYLAFSIFNFCGLVHVTAVLYPLLMWASSTSFWFSSCLCFFYCVKIGNFNHHLFFWLKMRISKAVPTLLLLSVVVSLVFNIHTVWNSYGDNEKNNASLTTNATVTSVDKKSRTLNFWQVGVLGSFLPVLLNFVSFLLILMSLYRHTQRMRKNAPDFSQTRLQAHFGAARMIGALFLLYIIMLLVGGLSAFVYHDWLSDLFGIITISCKPAHFIILIMGTPKLRRSLCKILSLWRK